ncbi:NUDIX domain-containing protein [Thermosediminibacter litoriperuensis]|uniref:ADP-ribose pyrophosphatase YjhB (NUDIX family) n=1 Tax=Thermosediminibacter litoriperuensis TaxID=291989 RepID=A0A5S5ADH8_9FIRM|nr:NUDIX hydrolase [Thermosediminibacter litoriperuensis]TYP47669.1 ADP-ribose pyrophosphatase YjhB (NUDIX family) [Thermosediminibacter litoriperuensis]
MYPNYRISVEIILLHEGKVLLTKRAEHCKVAPNVWNVPAGKIKYDEIPVQGLYREAKEEINLDVELLEELSVRNLKSKSGDEDIYRVVFTYLVKPKNDDISSLKLNDEHSELAWITKEDLNNPRYETLHNDIRNILLTKVFK